MNKLAVIGESGWMQTYEGKRFEVTAPTEDMISIVDIAHALSMQCRYNGHTKYFYSTAEHLDNMMDTLMQAEMLVGKY